MKKLILFILIFSSLSLAMDSETFFPETAGDQQLYKPDFSSDSQMMTYLWNITKIPPIIDSKAYVMKIIYDLRIELEELKQKPGKEFSFKIFIKNNGDTPDEDSELIYYLESPDKTISSEAKETIFEVPPINYDEYNCIRMAGTIDGDQCITILERKVKLPSNAVLGEWTLKAEYYTVVQPVRTAHQTFEVVEKITFDKFMERYWWCFLIILILIVLLTLAVALNRKKNP